MCSRQSLADTLAYWHRIFPQYCLLRFAIREVGFLHYPHIQLLHPRRNGIFDVDIGHGLGCIAENSSHIIW